MTRTPSLDELSLDEKIGQLFVPDAYGTFMNRTSANWKRLERFVRDRHVGGIIWFLSNVYETALLNKRLQQMARVPLLISADLEAGMGMRFVDTTFWPPAMAVAATGDPSLAERQGKAVAIEARTAGINHILAPVSDVNVDPDNPVINTRSFGEDPATVAKFVSAFIRGVQSERVLATAKHFPGHGDTHVDSHRSLPVLDVTPQRLDDVELVPFRAAIAADVASVMIGHLSVPSLDATPAPVRTDGIRENRYVAGEHEAPSHGTLPATLSKPIVDGVLREKLGFDGLVVTDAFDMGGLTEHFDAGEAAIRAIEAGEDQIMFSANTDAAIDAVKSAVIAGRLSQTRIDESVRRILAAKARVSHDVGDPDEIFSVVDSDATRTLAAEIAAKSLTLLREESGVLPLRASTRATLLVVTDFAETNPLADFEREVRTRCARLTTLQVDARTTVEATDAATRACRGSDVVIAALAIRARSGHGRLAMPAAAKTIFDGMKDCAAKLVTVSFGSPYVVREIPHVPTYLCAWAPVPVVSVAVARALFGEAKIGGNLPVTIPGLFARGDGISR